LLGSSGDDQLYAGAGNDRIIAGNGNDLVLGGAGNDNVNGGGGRDLLIGGSGTDTISGSSHDDILVAGTTTHDANEANLMALLDEWVNGADTYAGRVSNLENGGGLNGAVVLNDTTVTGDGLPDVMSGQGGSDWWLAGPADTVRDLRGAELQVAIT
jgi:Ca2+-binding RTX toxin-like protein